MFRKICFLLLLSTIVLSCFLSLEKKEVSLKKRTAIQTENQAISCSTSGSDSWYCMHQKDGKRPPIPAEMSYLTDHQGYFIGKDTKTIYLTFDAGYENGNIAKVLDILKEENVSAAFFILENITNKNKDLVLRMENEGHLVCNHTAVHPDMTKMQTKEAFESELKRMEDKYFEATGKEISKYYRPPQGKLNEQNLIWAEELGYKTILWSYAYADWDNNNQPSPQAALEKVLSGVHNGEVLLLHPTSETNTKILKSLIEELKAKGYTFGTLDELTKEEAQE